MSSSAIDAISANRSFAVIQLSVLSTRIPLGDAIVRFIEKNQRTPIPYTLSGLFRVNTTTSSLPSTHRSGSRLAFSRRNRIMHGMPLPESVTRPQLEKEVVHRGIAQDVDTGQQLVQPDGVRQPTWRPHLQPIVEDQQPPDRARSRIRPG